MRDTYFDVTSKNAIEIILADSKKTNDAREEDAKFVRRLRQNEFVKFGGRDWTQQKRFDRAHLREEARTAREKKELKRKNVR